MCNLTIASCSWSTDFTSSFRDWISFSITIQPRLTIFGPHFDDGTRVYNFVVLWFSLFSEKYFTQEDQVRHRSVYTCFVLEFVLSSCFYTPAPRRGRGYTVLPLSVCPSFRPSKIFFVAFFSVTVDGRNLIFGHKHHIGIPYCG
jgi:hypothetical protein